MSKRNNELKLSPISIVLALAVWVINYIILTYGNPQKVKFSKSLVVVVISIVIISVICVVVDCAIIASFEKCYAKYREDSYQLDTIRTNYQFLHSIISLFFDSFIGCVLVLFHALRIKSTNDCENNFGNIAVPQTIARVFVIVLMAIMLISIKGIVFPYSSFKSINVSTATSYRYTTDKDFHRNIYTMTLYRVGDTRKPELCFGLKKVTILCDNSEVAYYFSPFVEKVESFKEYEVGSGTAFVYGNSAISYIENGIPHTVLFSDIHKCIYNPILIEVCQKLIDEGNVVAFEYAAEYLLKYAPDFISQYIVRYSDGNFNEFELSVLYEVGYYPEYISLIAKSLK